MKKKKPSLSLPCKQATICAICAQGKGFFGQTEVHYEIEKSREREKKISAFKARERKEKRREEKKRKERKRRERNISYYN